MKWAHQTKANDGKASLAAVLFQKLFGKRRAHQKRAKRPLNDVLVTYISRDVYAGMAEHIRRVMGL
jgi:hypothetical protein